METRLISLDSVVFLNFLPGEPFSGLVWCRLWEKLASSNYQVLLLRLRQWASAFFLIRLSHFWKTKSLCSQFNQALKSKYTHFIILKYFTKHIYGLPCARYYLKCFININVFLTHNNPWDRYCYIILIFFFFFFWPHHGARKILVPPPGIKPHQTLNPGPRQWKLRVLTTGPPGNSQHYPHFVDAETKTGRSQ